MERHRFIWLEYDMMNEAKEKARTAAYTKLWERYPKTKWGCCTFRPTMSEVSALAYLKKRYDANGKIYYEYRLAWTSVGCWVDTKVDGENILHFYKIINPILLNHLRTHGTR